MLAGPVHGSLRPFARRVHRGWYGVIPGAQCPLVRPAQHFPSDSGRSADTKGRGHAEARARSRRQRGRGASAGASPGGRGLLRRAQERSAACVLQSLDAVLRSAVHLVEHGGHPRLRLRRGPPRVGDHAALARSPVRRDSAPLADRRCLFVSDEKGRAATSSSLRPVRLRPGAHGPGAHGRGVRQEAAVVLPAWSAPGHDRPRLGELRGRHTRRPPDPLVEISFADVCGGRLARPRAPAAAGGAEDPADAGAKK